MTPSPEATLCRRAAQFIEARGFCQCTYEDHAARLCLKGALNLVAYGHPVECGVECGDSISLVNKVANHIAQRVGAESAIWWNDAPGRTKADVLAALRATADEFEQEVRHG